MKKIVLFIVVVFSFFIGGKYINRKGSPIAEDNNLALPTQQAFSEEKTSTDLGNDIFVNSESGTNNKTDNVAQDISLFIPEGWEVLKKSDDELAIAEGDLNNDGFSDKAFVIEQINPEEMDSPRSLLIILGDEDDTYSLSIMAEKAILLTSEGGTFGDPFEDIVIDRGSVLLKFMGGSSRCHKYYRFRYQNDGWYLIGFTEGSYESIGDSMYCLQNDYNLITGDYVGEELIDGEVKTIEKNVGKKELLNLKDFVASEYTIQFQ